MKLELLSKEETIKICIYVLCCGLSKQLHYKISETFSIPSSNKIIPNKKIEGFPGTNVNSIV